MKTYTDNVEFAEQVLGGSPGGWQPQSEWSLSLGELVGTLYGVETLLVTRDDSGGEFGHFFVVESAPRSQYDVLIERARVDKSLPHGILCLAGEGRRFHGFRQRAWASPKGNVYLSVFFSPQAEIERFAAGFMALAAVSVVEAIDRVRGLEGRAGLKWVNDILIDDAKVCGVLAHTLSEGSRVTGAILGIGLNVETVPPVTPTAFVPRAGALVEYCEEQRQCTMAVVMSHLIAALADNYRLLVVAGSGPLLEKYRDRSVVVGRDVVVFDDTPGREDEVLMSGRVVGIGDNLELLLGGRSAPVIRGRLAFKNDVST